MVTRDDWIDVAVSALDEVSIDQLKVLGLARRLGVSRSSFYWFFEDPEELRAELLTVWEGNTSAIVERAERSAPTIVRACLGVFECWTDPQLYVPALDAAVRDWARRDDEAEVRMAAADLRRLDALTEMFLRHDFDPVDAVVRARLLYHSQVGYYVVGTDEPTEIRMAFLQHYLEAMTGRRAEESELAAFEAVVEEIASRQVDESGTARAAGSAGRCRVLRWTGPSVRARRRPRRRAWPRS